MKIVVASQDFCRVSDHAGRAQRFLIYDVPQSGDPVETGRLDLPKPLACRDAADAAAFPIAAGSVLLAAGFRPRFVKFMAQHGVAAVLTGISEPLEAVRAYAACGAPGSPA